MQKYKQILGVLFVLGIIMVGIFPISAKAASAQLDFTLLGDAYYDTNNDCYVLTEEHTWESGALWFDQVRCSDNFSLSFDFYTGHGEYTNSLDGADGICVAFYAVGDYIGDQGERLGFDGCGGFGVEIDTYPENPGDVNYNHIAIVRDSTKNHLKVADATKFTEDGKWHHLTIRVCGDICTVYVDGFKLLQYDQISDTGNNSLGITAATGDGFNFHAVKNIDLTEYNNKVKVSVFATDKESGQKVPVPDADVNLYVGSELNRSADNKTDANGVTEISLAGLSRSDRQKATVSAYKVISSGSAIGGHGRDELFECYPRNDSGEIIRYQMELHSETIDSNGNWLGADLPEANTDDSYPEMELALSEPRMLVNLSVCYLADDKTSKSDSYRDSMKRMLNEYSHRMAESTDGHVLIDKVLLFNTDNRLNFYDTSNPASMADIRIETRESDDGTWWNNVTVHSNAYIGGFYSEQTYIASKDKDGVVENFKHLKDADKLLGKSSFRRIQLSGTEGAGWNNSMIKKPQQYSTTVMHETGHYLLTFFDEYLAADGSGWREHKPNDKPYAAFGLMDNQHDDWEMSKAGIDYSYATNGINSLPFNGHTMQSYINMGSAEDTLAKLLETGTSFDGFTSHIDMGEYDVKYTKVTGSSDRKCNYSYAALSDDNYISYASAGSGGGGGSSWAAFPEEDDADHANDALSEVSWTPDDNGVTVTIIEQDDYSDYNVLVRGTNDDGFTPIDLSDNSASLPILDGDVAEVRVEATASTGEVLYNTYYVDRSGTTDSGYYYVAPDNGTIAYVTNSEDSSYTFVADNTPYSDGDYFSVSQATFIHCDSGELEGGEIYAAASYLADVDYSTISWFKFSDGLWTKLASDQSSEESMNIGIRADIDGEGLYVLMAKRPNGVALPAQDVVATPSSTANGEVYISFTDPNSTSRYYNVYTESGELIKSFEADSTNLVIILDENESAIGACIEIVLQDGSRSERSSVVQLVGGVADRDSDGIPDDFCDEYLLWGNDDGENKDIANSDDDDDGLSNLEEYLRGSDPTDPNDPEHYTVFFNSNGGSVDLEKKVVIFGLNYGDLPIPARNGYDFVGWYTTLDGDNEIGSETVVDLVADQELFAHWNSTTQEEPEDPDDPGEEEGEYTVKFDKNGGEGTMSPQTFTIGVKQALTANKFTRKGYTFTGWNTDAKGKGKSYKNKEAVKNLSTKDGATVTLYARWKADDEKQDDEKKEEDIPKEYTITYNMNGGINAYSNPAKYKDNESVTLAAPTKTGYTFDGWYSDSRFTSKVTVIAKGGKDSVTLYAKWTANIYTIKFDGNGSSEGNMENLTATYDQAVALTENVFTKARSSFKGWNTKANGKGTSYADGAAVKNLSAENGATVMLYAQWAARPGKYTITYVLNGGTNNAKNPEKYDEDWETITLEAPTKEGYTFAGWYKNAKLTKKSASIPEGSTGDKTFYAKWKANKYTVKFNKNGGKGKMSALKNKVYDKKFKLSANKFKRKGYKFAGWNTKKDGTGTQYKNKASVKNLTAEAKGTVTLYAQWKKKK